MANDPNRDFLPVKEENYKVGRVSSDKIDHQILSKLPRSELEDKCLRLLEEQMQLKKKIHSQEEKIKRLGTKLLRIMEDRKTGRRTSSEIVKDSEDLRLQLIELERENYALKDHNTVLKQQLASNSHLTMDSRSPIRSSRTGPSGIKVREAPQSETNEVLESRAKTEDELREAETHIKELNEEIKSLHLKIDYLQQKMEKNCLDNRKTKVTENIELIRLQRSLKQQAIQIASLQAQVKNSEQNQMLLKEELLKAHKENDEALHLITLKQNEVLSLCGRLDENNVNRLEESELRERINDLVKERDALKERSEYLMKVISQKQYESERINELKKLLSEERLKKEKLEEILEGAQICPCCRIDDNFESYPEDNDLPKNSMRENYITRPEEGQLSDSSVRPKESLVEVSETSMRAINGKPHEKAKAEPTPREISLVEATPRTRTTETLMTEATPGTRETSTIETTPKMRETSTIETIPKTRETSTVETTPKTRESSTMETIPRTRKTSTIETIPRTRKTSTIETIPKTRETSRIETTPRTRETSTIETTPRTRETSITEPIRTEKETLAVEPIPRARKTSIVEETPEPEEISKVEEIPKKKDSERIDELKRQLTEEKLKKESLEEALEKAQKCLQNFQDEIKKYTKTDDQEKRREPDARKINPVEGTETIQMVSPSEENPSPLYKWSRSNIYAPEPGNTMSGDKMKNESSSSAPKGSPEGRCDAEKIKLEREIQYLRGMLRTQTCRCEAQQAEISRLMYELKVNEDKCNDTLKKLDTQLKAFQDLELPRRNEKYPVSKEKSEPKVEESVQTSKLSLPSVHKIILSSDYVNLHSPKKDVKTVEESVQTSRMSLPTSFKSTLTSLEYVTPNSPGKDVKTVEESVQTSRMSLHAGPKSLPTQQEYTRPKIETIAEYSNPELPLPKTNSSKSESSKKNPKEEKTKEVDPKARFTEQVFLESSDEDEKETFQEASFGKNLEGLLNDKKTWNKDINRERGGEAFRMSLSTSPLKFTGNRYSSGSSQDPSESSAQEQEKLVRAKTRRESNSSQKSIPSPDALKNVEKVTISMLWLQLEPTGSIWKEDSIKFLYIDFSFLDVKGENTETPDSLPKPNCPEKKLVFNFSHTVEITKEKEEILIFYLENLDQELIVFKVISEPEDSEDDCIDVGIAVITSKEFLEHFNRGFFSIQVNSMRNLKEAVGRLWVNLNVKYGNQQT